MSTRIDRYGIKPFRMRQRAGALLVLGMALSGIAPGEDGPQVDRDALLAEAQGALAAGRPAVAERLYRELITVDPQEVEPFLGLAEVYVHRGRSDAAVTLLLQVARELTAARRHGEAVPPLERAIELAPGSLEAHLALARALAEDRRYVRAAEIYERARELGEEGLETLLYLAACYWESQQLEAAEAVYGRARELHGEVFGLEYHLGQFLLWQGRAAEAMGPLERAADLERQHPGVFFHLARARAESGDVRGAVGGYERVLELIGDGESELRDKAGHALEILRQRVDRGVPGAGAVSPPSEGRPGTVVALTPVAAELGVRFRHHPGNSPGRHLPETMGSGLAWLDYDGDGWWDLHLVQSGPFPPDGDETASDRLLRNLGPARDGHVTFEDVTDEAGAGCRCYGQGAVAADVDGDGDVDLYLTCYGPDVLLINRGDGTFEDGTAAAGLMSTGWSSSSALADVDGDGDLDLYVSRYVNYDPEGAPLCGTPGKPDYCNVVHFEGVTDQLFRQRDDGSFEDVSSAAGLVAGRGLGVVWTDLDRDLRPDLYVANDLDPNRLYRNLGGGPERLRFEEISLLSGAALDRAGEPQAGMGIAAGDIDGDGLPELLVSNFDVETNTLYRNLGGLVFEDVSAATGFALPSFNKLGFGLELADFDGDGDADVYVANGHVFEHPRREGIDRAQVDLLLINDGRGGFQEQALPLAPAVGRGLAVADFDHDGDPDMAIQNNGGWAELLRNDRGAGPWLGVELVGKGRNTQAVGARVELVTDRPGSAPEVLRTQVRQVMAGRSYQSSSDRRPLFAWPLTEEVRELRIFWPSGRVTRWIRPPRDRYLRVVEPVGARRGPH